nr:gem-associated protein 5-like isoform X1 [Cherax quadricarinatus]XP_053639248.1 gem-associated protein 5-like isoform X1 [Cherax quadricarinatus]
MIDSYKDEDHFWERGNFLSFGPLPKCHFHCNIKDLVKHEIGDVLLPPSPNWFISDAVDCRLEDNLLVTGAFKAIIVYKVSTERRLPKVLKVIPHNSERVLSIRLHRRAFEPDYGHTVASTADTSTIRLYNLHTGDVIATHYEHQGLSVNGICWGSIGGEEVVVTVGCGGRMVVWQARHGVTRVHTLHQFSELTLVEANPKEPSQVLIAAEQDIALVSLKDGGILTHLQGHDYVIYSIKWYVGKNNPFLDDSEPVNHRAEGLKQGCAKLTECNERNRIKENSRQQNTKALGSFDGQYFVSSDYGRNILLWDLSAKRYITKINVPLSASAFKKQMSGKEKNSGKQHIALAWHNGNLLTSTVRGELLLWTLQPTGSKFKALHHLHTRAIYNVVVIGDVAVTSGQDRFLHGFHIGNSSHLFQVPTLGACATSLSFCPHDANRLAIGSQENNIRLLNFGSEIPLHTQLIWQNIKGKILSLSWHPAHEGWLLFGTGSGQVGWADVSSGRVTTFAYYHQKAVYKVEWGPSVCPQQTGLADNWCAYSFGDREIVIRNSSDPMADSIRLHKLAQEMDAVKIPKDVTEFSFSPDYKYLAIGSQDGQVQVHQSCDLKLMVTLVVVRKAIQHLLWQPPSDSSIPYILAIGSSENKIQIFNLEKNFKGEEGGNVLTQATQELCGHESRVVWLAWSPHKTGVLASASYDHTVQLWDTKTGKPMVNYGGHTTRVFRVEFSPADPDLLYSFAEENNVHAWRPSKLKCKTSSESSATLKEYLPKKVKEKEQTAAATAATAQAVVKEAEKPQKVSASSEKKTGANKSSGQNFPSSNASGGKKAVYKSFFPKLHMVCSRKKSFHQLAILNLLAQLKVTNISGLNNINECEIKEVEEDLEEDLGEDSNSRDEGEDDYRSVIVDTTEKYSYILEKDSEMATPDDFIYALNMFGNPHQMDTLLTSEIEHHEARGNDSQVGLMHCWRGTLDEHIRSAARHMKLTPFLVASAPQVSINLWKLASEAYAEQLVNEGDIVTAASYLVNISKVKEAVKLLLKYRLYREALAITKCRLGYDEEMVETVVTTWAASAIYEGNFDLASTLHLSLGHVEDAAHCMSRRSDPGALFISAKLYEHAGNVELTNSVGLLALREAALKHEHLKIDSFINHLPNLNWFRTIFCCHNVILDLLQQVTMDKEGQVNYLTKSRRKQKNQVYQETPNESKIVNETADIEGKSNINANVNGDVITPRNTQNCTSEEWVPLLERIEEEWLAQGITREQYPQLYETITLNFSTQQIPTSVKQLWFLVSVALSEYLMSSCLESWDQHLTTALGYVVSWGKADHIFHLTHALLPKGVNCLMTLGTTVVNEVDKDASSTVNHLRHLYYAAEISILHLHIHTDEFWSKLHSHSSDIKNEIPEGETLRHSEELETIDKESIPSEFAKEGETTVASKSGTLTVPADKSEHMDSTEKEIIEYGRAYCLPQSSNELITVLNLYFDNLNPTYMSAPDVMGLNSGLSSPEKLLLEIILKLRERGDISEDEIRKLLCKVPANRNIF